MKQPISWRTIWGRRQVPAGDLPLLERLLLADGHDNRFGRVDIDGWHRYVLEVGRRLRLRPGDSVFDVGCGAGAFLLPLAEAGHRVGGIDLSAGLLAGAREAMPAGSWQIGDAASLATGRAWDAVVSSGVFLYLDSFDHASTVLGRMAACAGSSLAVLDVADRDRAAAARAAREQIFGAEEYARRYAGLEHLAFDRQWFENRLDAQGFDSVEITDQFLAGYGNAPYRFNVLARRRRPQRSGGRCPSTGCGR